MVTSGRPTLAPEIDEFRTQFEQLSADADALTTPLTDEQFTWRPDSDSWSIAECLDHLNATARVYGDGPFKYNWLGRLSLRFSEMRVRFTAAENLQPGSGRTRREILAAFRAYQVQYIDRLRQANGVDLARARVRMPAAAWLKIPLGSGLAVVIAHSRRHLSQAKRVTEHEHFPG